MTLNIIATVILAYFIVRECVNVYEAWRDGYAFGWTVVGTALVVGLLTCLYVVWA